MAPPTYVGWKIYYVDGTTFSSKDGPPGLAPRTGIAIVSVYFSKVTTDPGHPDFGRNYRKRYQGTDWYWIRPGNPPSFGRTNIPADIPPQAIPLESGMELEVIDWIPLQDAAYRDWDWDAA